ncbi:MAG: sigma-70 family RNA polymerase sigma factor [Lachnospiraceae bacterium]|nr:sigma-70 family RNA polymerase sigma factor [Lachnospiraceae bacterium]
MISVYLSLLSGEEEKGKFERLFRTYYQSMLKEAQRIIGSYAEAEEVVQEVFFKVIEVLDKFPEKPCKKEHSLLIIMTRNKAIDIVRKKGKRSETSFGEERLLEDLSDPEVEYIQKEGVEKILSFLDELPENYRSVLLLHIADGWKVKDIAEFLGISVHMAEVRLSRGKKLLKNRIIKAMEEHLPKEYRDSE